MLADRAETGSRHGRATFSVLLFQDLAVVVLLMLIPLLAPQEGAAVGFATISKALGCAAAVAAPAATIAVAAIVAAATDAYNPTQNILFHLHRSIGHHAVEFLPPAET